MFEVVKIDTHQRDYSEETLAKMMQTPSRPRRQKATSLDDAFFSSVDVKRDSMTNLDGDFFQEEHAPVKVKSHKRDSTDLDDGFFDAAVKPMHSSATDLNDVFFGDVDVSSRSLSVSSGRTYSRSHARMHSFGSSISRGSGPVGSSILHTPELEIPDALEEEIEEFETENGSIEEPKASQDLIQ